MAGEYFFLMFDHRTMFEHKNTPTRITRGGAIRAISLLTNHSSPTRPSNIIANLFNTIHASRTPSHKPKHPALAKPKRGDIIVLSRGDFLNRQLILRQIQQPRAILNINPKPMVNRVQIIILLHQVGHAEIGVK
jgi:hypothetical protein